LSIFFTPNCIRGRRYYGVCEDFTLSSYPANPHAISVYDFISGFPKSLPPVAAETKKCINEKEKYGSTDFILKVLNF